MSTSTDIATIRALKANVETLSELNLNQAKTIEDQQRCITDLKVQLDFSKREYATLQAQVKELEAIPRDEADGFNKIIAHYQQQAEDSAFRVQIERKDRIIDSLETELKRYRECLEAIAAESEMKIPTGNGWTYTYSEMAAKALKPPE